MTTEEPKSARTGNLGLSAYALFVTVACAVLVWQTTALRREIARLRAQASEAMEKAGSGALTIGERVPSLTGTGCLAGSAEPVADAQSALNFTDGRAATVVLLVSGGCDLCAHSFPFFHTLASSFSGGSVRFVSVQVDAEGLGDLKGQGSGTMPLCAVESASTTWARRVPIVPATVVVDGAGAVRRTWFGELSARQQEDLHALLVEFEGRGGG